MAENSIKMAHESGVATSVYIVYLCSSFILCELEAWESRYWFVRLLQCQMITTGQFWDKKVRHIYIYINIYIYTPKCFTLQNLRHPSCMSFVMPETCFLFCVSQALKRYFAQEQWHPHDHIGLILHSNYALLVNACTTSCPAYSRVPMINTRHTKPTILIKGLRLDIFRLCAMLRRYQKAHKYGSLVTCKEKRLSDKNLTGPTSVRTLMILSRIRLLLRNVMVMKTLSDGCGRMSCPLTEQMEWCRKEDTVWANQLLFLFFPLCHDNCLAEQGFYQKLIDDSRK